MARGLQVACLELFHQTLVRGLTPGGRYSLAWSKCKVQRYRKSTKPFTTGQIDQLPWHLGQGRERSSLTSPPGRPAAHLPSRPPPALPIPEPLTVRRGFRERCGRPFRDHPAIRPPCRIWQSPTRLLSRRGLLQGDVLTTRGTRFSAWNIYGSRHNFRGGLTGNPGWRDNRSTPRIHEGNKHHGPTGSPMLMALARSRTNSSWVVATCTHMPVSGFSQ